MEELKKEIDEVKRDACLRLLDATDIVNAAVARGEIEPKEAMDLLTPVIEVFAILWRKEIQNSRRSRSLR